MWKRRRSDGDFDEEIQAHIRLEADRLAEEGMDQEEALAAARRAFGNVTRSRERFYESRRSRWLERLTLDFRHAIRRLAREPRFTATALVTLAVCLGANLTIFAVVDSVLLRPLPFPEADRLVTLFNSYPKAGKERDDASLTSYYERQGQIPAFARMAALMEVTAVVGESGSTERVAVGRVSADFFATLGVRLFMGRAFTEAEMTYQTDHEAILTHEYWRQRFAGDPDVLGRDVRSDGLRPDRRSPSARFPIPLVDGARLPAPLVGGQRAQPRRPTQRQHRCRSPGCGGRHPGRGAGADRRPQCRARGGVPPREAGRRVRFPDDRRASPRRPRRLDPADPPAPAGGGALPAPHRRRQPRQPAPDPGHGPAQELAIRQSMGANRRQVVSQVMVETVLLALIGGLLGLVVGSGGVRLLGVLGRRPLAAGRPRRLRRTSWPWSPSRARSCSGA